MNLLDLRPGSVRHRNLPCFLQRQSASPKHRNIKDQSQFHPIRKHAPFREIAVRVLDVLEDQRRRDLHRLLAVRLDRPRIRNQTRHQLPPFVLDQSSPGLHLCPELGGVGFVLRTYPGALLSILMKTAKDAEATKVGPNWLFPNCAIRQEPKPFNTGNPKFAFWLIRAALGGSPFLNFTKTGDYFGGVGFKYYDGVR
ncbi:Desiccation protectant protein Lea14-like protein [Senna tora]|uniref:Desiccation protectant protein Lea14-like protein n=1 Tax=Senna tora TaxID=362788 RepID=A0A834WAU0_9FABA|nr:Desiccation protectant protein Lea14-like protein [Senna tora]